MLICLHCLHIFAYIHIDPYCTYLGQQCFVLQYIQFSSCAITIITNSILVIHSKLTAMPLYLQTAEKPFRMMNIVSENSPDEFSDVKKDQVACFFFLWLQTRKQFASKVRPQLGLLLYKSTIVAPCCTTHNPNTQPSVFSQSHDYNHMIGSRCSHDAKAMSCRKPAYLHHSKNRQKVNRPGGHAAMPC